MSDFRLSRVLAVKRAEKKLLASDLARIHTELGSLAARRDELRDRCMELRRSSFPRRSVDLYCRRLEAEVAALDEREDRLCVEAALVIGRIESVDRRIKALEKLEAKHAERLRAKLRKGEQRRIDLVAGRRRRAIRPQ